MPLEPKHPKRPRDLNQWAKRVVDLATMDDKERKELQKPSPKKASKTRPQKPGKRASS
jgi:hypothetical protein